MWKSSREERSTNMSFPNSPFRQLKIAERSGEDGLYEVFTAKNSDGQPRVSNQRKLLEEIIPKLAAFCDKRV